MKKKPLIRHKKIIIPSLIFVALIVGFISFKFLNTKKQTNLAAENTNTETDNNIDYSPPTKEDKSNNDAFKEKLGDNKPSAPQSNGEKKKVIPVISFWGQNQGNNSVEVGSFISEVVESGGTCTLTMSKGAQQETTKTDAIKDATTTTCGTMTIARASLNPGKWTAKVTYLSATSEGVSDNIFIEVQ